MGVRTGGISHSRAGREGENYPLWNRLVYSPMFKSNPLFIHDNLKIFGRAAGF